MIKCDWNIFREKFSENPQDNFEWFCYLLFCREFNRKKGIFRFKNQTAIETNPIEHRGKVFGWQSKFYDTPLTSHKNDFIKCIDRAKDTYPEITDILIYTNKDWGQAKGKKIPQEPVASNEPKAQIDIEKRAKARGIRLVWRTSSFFESEFVSLENEDISKHFFSLNTSLLDQIELQQKHTENILFDIRTRIDFEDQIIEFNREPIIEELKRQSHKIVILSGVAGVGKTAVIKKLYEEYRDKTPFYVFKATEFELKHIDDLFSDFAFQKFVDGHKDDSNKYVVIDSAEKLLDLNNNYPFREFLRTLINDNWHIIFTSRYDFLDVLTTHFSEIYDIIPKNTSISNLSTDELISISEQHGFTLPADYKLTDLITNLFYLSEYLRYYVKGEELDYAKFKEKLWNKVIVKAKPQREECFLQISLERANSGQFFINPSCNSEILDALKADGVLGYESSHGYYITHDIYEEWALERIIESVFVKRLSTKNFFSNISRSLPIRRSFRNWVSEKLLIENDSIMDFIEDVVQSDEVEKSWKDEVIVSVMLSDHSDYSFDFFKEDLLNNNQELLQRITFLIRIACKEVDYDFYKRLGMKKPDIIKIEHLLTEPKGRGWNSLIKFIYENLDAMGVSSINFILPIIHDWVSKNKEGMTVQHSGLIALYYYEKLIEEDRVYSLGKAKNRLLYTIVNSSTEIKKELEKIFTKIIQNGWNSHRDPYYDLSKFVLTDLEGLYVSKVLPKFVLQLADLFWYSVPKKTYYSSSRGSINESFHISESRRDYYPASSYQTPIYFLLKSAFKDTIDFIIEFTNKTVEAYVSSDIGRGDVEEIHVYTKDDKPVKQYISNRLWCVYRGTQGVPNILESMHMALEKFLLELGEIFEYEELEKCLLYLLKKSKSASISAVVTSIVLAFPDKTFNVAKVLFKTKEFFIYDTKRLVLDRGHKSTLENLKTYAGRNSKNAIYEDERIKTCDKEHRKFTLEHLCLNYQMFRSEGVSEEEAEARQKDIWDIFDKYYKELPETSKQTEHDKLWRRCLARMDRRKMNLTTREVDKGIEIHFNPDVEPELLEHSERTIQHISSNLKYLSLKTWAEQKLRNEEGYKKHKEYENDPMLALQEAKEIVSILNGRKYAKSEGILTRNDQAFSLMHSSIPAIVCATLVKYYFELMSADDQQFCKNVVMDGVKSTLKPEYDYQIGDESQPSISVLPILLSKFPQDADTIKLLLLLSLFNDYPVNWAGTGFNIFPINAIHELWESNFETAQSLLLGYLLLKPKYEVYQHNLKQENYKKGIYRHSSNQDIEGFVSDSEEAISAVIENNISRDDIGDLKNIDLEMLYDFYIDMSYMNK